MVRFSLRTTFVAYAGLAVMNTVTAGPTVTETNSTQIMPSVYKPAPNNPFAGLSLDLEISPRSMDLVTRSVSEVELESRQFAQIAKAAVDVISKVVDLVKGIIEKDKERRSKFTQEVVSAGMKAHPEFNWIICHVKHHYKFKGTENKDWGKRHEEYSVSFGRTIGYDIYYLREGEFWSEGDGGYLNWSFIGFFKRDGDQNRHLTFTRPPGH